MKINALWVVTTDGISSQMATNAENYSMSKRYLEAAVAYSVISVVIFLRNGEYCICIMALKP